MFVSKLSLQQYSNKTKNKNKNNNKNNNNEYINEPIINLKYANELSPHLLMYAKAGFDIKKSTGKFSRILNNKSRRKEYKKEDESKIHIHYGQRKLLMTEIEFIINEYHKLDTDPKKQKIFLYIGASAGKGSIHSYFLAKMFPEFEYHLFDKNDFFDDLYNLPNVKIFKRWFTEKDIKTYKNKNVFMVSDLRDPDIGKAKKAENTLKSNEIVFDDMTLQQTFYNKIKPKSALLKFRLPWQPGKTEYLDGTIYYQMWQGPYSAESRLIPTAPNKTKIYDNTGYEQRIFYFNTETRRRYYPYSVVKQNLKTLSNKSSNKSSNKNKNKHNHAEKEYPCYGHCYDCISEITVLQRFINTHSQNKKLTVCELGKKITEFLSINTNKRLFKSAPLDHYKI